MSEYTTTFVKYYQQLQSLNLLEKLDKGELLHTWAASSIFRFTSVLEL